MLTAPLYILLAYYWILFYTLNSILYEFYLLPSVKYKSIDINTILQEIDASEYELLKLKAELVKEDKQSVKTEAAALREEVAIIKDKAVEGLVEDVQSQYFISVGLIEQSNENLRQLIEMNEKISENSNQTLEYIR